MFRMAAHYKQNHKPNNRRTARTRLIFPYEPLGKETIIKRLQNINYELEKMPLLFRCSITDEPFENPIQTGDKNNFERIYFKQYLNKNPDFDPLGSEITTNFLNKDLKDQIHKYVGCLEKIHELHNNLVDLAVEKVDIDNLKIEDLGLAKEEHTQLENEQRKLLYEANQRKTLQNKLQLATELNLFIKLTETAIYAEERKEEDKLQEIVFITEDKVTVLETLRYELGESHPELFDAQRHHNKQDHSAQKITKRIVTYLIDRHLFKKTPPVSPLTSDEAAYSTQSPSSSEHSSPIPMRAAGKSTT